MRNGATYYQYAATYTCPITVTSTSWSQTSDTFLNVVTTCQKGSRLSSSIFDYSHTILVDGTTTLTKDNGWSTAMA